LREIKGGENYCHYIYIVQKQIDHQKVKFREDKVRHGRQEKEQRNNIRRARKQDNPPNIYIRLTITSIYTRDYVLIYFQRKKK
jgi:hypothetical protein